MGILFQYLYIKRIAIVIVIVIVHEINYNKELYLISM